VFTEVSHRDGEASDVTVNPTSFTGIYSVAAVTFLQ